jgi:N-acetylglucosaminyldiphosphoundecaprenol N-acetyl-beta-D-mannosaminyltransferase
MNKQKLFSVPYSITDYDGASDLIIEKAISHQTFGVSALAVHGLIECVRQKSFSDYLNRIDMIVPDGQPIKWALNSFHHLGLKERVAGPILTLHVLSKANKNALRVFLYGSTSATLSKIQNFIHTNYPNIIICGIHADRFREATPDEDLEDIEKIRNSDANIILVGRGCPRQERWVANHIGKIQAPMLAVGAAFDFMAGNIEHAPQWMKDCGLEWFHRLLQDPKKLWRRYLITNSYFIYLCLISKMGIRKV